MSSVSSWVLVTVVGEGIPDKAVVLLEVGAKKLSHVEPGTEVSPYQVPHVYLDERMPAFCRVLIQSEVGVQPVPDKKGVPESLIAANVLHYKAIRI